MQILKLHVHALCAMTGAMESLKSPLGWPCELGSPLGFNTVGLVVLCVCARLIPASSIATTNAFNTSTPPPPHPSATICGISGMQDPVLAATGKSAAVVV